MTTPARPSTVHNPTTGQVIPASWGDAVNDCLDYLMVTKPHMRSYHNANQSIANATTVAVAMNSERWDVGGMHSTVSNTSRGVAPDAGKYALTFCARFASDNDGYRQVAFRKNGAGNPIGGVQRTTSIQGDVTIISSSTEVLLAASDYIEPIVEQTAGNALNVLNDAEYSPEFTMRWVAS